MLMLKSFALQNFELIQKFNNHRKDFLKMFQKVEFWISGLGF